MALEKDTRDAIGRTVRALRSLFEEDFGKQSSGRFGIRSSPRVDVKGGGLDAWLDPMDSLSLTPAEYAQRGELVHALNYLTSEGNGPAEAVARLIREAAFTVVNRLLAVRVAEAIGILPEVLSAGRYSAGFKETVGDLFPGLANEENGYWTYLQIAGDELAPGVPRLFDRRYPTSAFVPSRACLDNALELLTADELASAWIEPETLGWGYQFFNGDDVKDMRDASAAPRNSRELAVRNQFFTPRYVVDWLVQNTLGRRLCQAGYELHLPLLVGEVGVDAPLELQNVRVLDPAVGSGHFLLGSYDLLEQAWQSVGVPPQEAAAKILPCLFGVDIDPRAAQVAQAVLLLRGRRSAPTASLSAPTIVTATGLPQGPGLREAVLARLSPATQHLVDLVATTLDEAPNVGSLLKIDQQLQHELAEQASAPRLALDGDQEGVMAELEAALLALASGAPSPEVRMFTADAADALRLLALLSKRFDAVMMNPPFGEGVDGSSRRVLKKLYPDWWTEIYACFLTRAFELLDQHGLVGVLSSSQFFMTRKMRPLRQLIAEDWPPIALLDLGSGVLAGATVNTAVGVYQHGRHDSIVQYSDLTDVDATDRERALTIGQIDLRAIDIRQFLNIDRIPFAFHVPLRALELWQGRDRLDPSVVEIRTGNNTFDDFRFVRLRWEITDPSLGWVPFQKGGEYKPYVEPSHLLIDWRADGRDLKEHATKAVGSTAQVMQSSRYWYRPGLTAPRVSSVGFGARILPEGEIFSGHSISFFPTQTEADRSAAGAYLIPLLGILNSTAFAELVRVFGRSRMTENGALKAMPLSPELMARAVDQGLVPLVEEACRIFAEWEVRDEASAYFGGPFALDGPTSSSAAADAAVASSRRLEEIQSEIDALVAGLFGFDPSATLDGDVVRRPHLVSTAIRMLDKPEKTWAQDVTSWAVGLVFNRWRHPNDSNGCVAVPDNLFGPLPPEPPASNDKPAFVFVESGERGLGRRVVDCLAELDTALVPDLERALSTQSLSDWVEDKFFGTHLQRYSRSRRYAPIYWQLSVPSKRWGLWLYAPLLSRESLFSIAMHTRENLSRVREQAVLAQKRSEQDRDTRERLESLEDLASEIDRFSGIVDEVAQSGWEPDLNDGFVLNAAPLEELFVDKKWRTQIADHRKAMQRGSYPWATVQRDYFAKRR